MKREHLEWRKIETNSEHYTYWVSNYGDIKRSESKFIDSVGRKLFYPEKIFWSEEQGLSGGDNMQGEYRAVNINGERLYAHRLAAKAFIPNPLNKPEVNHKDGNTVNNYCGCEENGYNDSNLEWVTRKENMGHASANGLINHESLLRKVTCRKNRENIDYSKVKKSVLQLDKQGKIINRFDSIIEASEKTGIEKTCINAVCKGRGHHKTAGGYNWLYADEYDEHNDYHVTIDQGSGGRKPVIQIDTNGNIVAKYNSITEACIKNNWTGNDYISQCCMGRKNTYKGYFWRFTDKLIK